MLKVGTHDETSPCNKSQELIALCELATSRGDQSHGVNYFKMQSQGPTLVPAASPMNSNQFEFVGLVAGTKFTRFCGKNDQFTQCDQSLQLVPATCCRDQSQGLVPSCADLNTSEKQAKYEQEEQKPLFQPSWPLKRPQFSFESCLIVSADSPTTDTMYWETGNVKIWKVIKKVNFPFMCCSVTTAILYPSQSASHGM